MDMLLQRLLHEDERRRIGDGDDGSRRAFVRFDFSMGLFFNLSTSIVGMLKMVILHPPAPCAPRRAHVPRFVLSRLSPSTYLPVRLGGQTPCGLAREVVRPWARCLSWQALGLVGDITPGDGGCDR